jgi:hypothetical protein
VKHDPGKDITRAPESRELETAKTTSAFAGRTAFFFYGLAASAAFWVVSSNWPTPKPAQARTPKVVRVAPTGGDYPSIPESLSFATAGDTIEIAPGIYPEKILLKNGITIRSATPGEATIGGGVIADGVKGAVLQDVKVGAFGIELNSSNVQLLGIESAGPVIFTGESTGVLRASRLGESLIVRDSSAPEIVLNYLDGDIEWLSSMPLKLSGNGVQGEILVRSPAPADLLEQNVVSDGKKAIHILKPGGEK